MTQTATLFDAQTITSATNGVARMLAVGEGVGLAHLSVSTLVPGSAPQLTVTIERRVGTAPWVIAATATVDAAAEVDLGVDLGDGRRAVEVRGVVTLSDVTSAVVALTLTAHSTYATLTDLLACVRERAIEELTPYERIKAIVDRHPQVDGYIAAAYTLPLASWDNDLREAEAALAAERLFQFRGTDPTGPDKVIFDLANNARTWLRHVSQGRIVPPGIVDAVGPSADAAGIGAVVATSRESRGW